MLMGCRGILIEKGSPDSSVAPRQDAVFFMYCYWHIDAAFTCLAGKLPNVMIFIYVIGVLIDMDLRGI